MLLIIYLSKAKWQQIYGKAMVWLFPNDAVIWYIEITLSIRAGINLTLLISIANVEYFSSLSH